MKLFLVLLSFSCISFSQAVMTIDATACRESDMSWNGTSIGLTANFHGTFTYFDGVTTTTVNEASCAGASSRVKGTSPESLTQIWRAGTSRETTLKLEVTNPDASTIQETVFITNNGTETITSFVINLIGYSVGENLGGNCSDGLSLRTSRYMSRYNMSLTWTAADSVLYMGDLSQNASVVPSCNPGPSRVVPLRSPYTNAMGDLPDLIGPGQTRQYTIFRKFYAPGLSSLEKARDAIKIYGSASTPQLVWDDRRPIATWFWAQTQHRAYPNNPRGYFSNTLNALDIPTFQARMNTEVTNVINLLNSRSPRQQGIILWDLEGYELAHAFTYLGSPNLLREVAPEMDAVADGVFAAFKNAGYRTGVTLRPQTFLIFDPGVRKRWAITGGTITSFIVSAGVATITTSTNHTLTSGEVVAVRGSATSSINNGREVVTVVSPTVFTFATAAPDGTYTDGGLFIEWANVPATCNAGTGLDRDVILLTGTITYPPATRSARCLVTNEWTFDTYTGGPTEQTRTDNYNFALNVLREKIIYANKRWGVTIFYVDTNVTITGGTMINKIWEDLLREFPNYLFIPEWESESTYQNAAPYLDYGNLDQLEIPSATMQGNQKGFASISVGDDDPNNDLTTWRNVLLRGSTYLPRGWFGDIQVTRMATIWNSVAPMARCVDVGARSYCANPRTTYLYPLIHRVYFSATIGGLATSNVYCEKTDLTRCYDNGNIAGTYDVPQPVNMSGLNYYQSRYYAYSGTLISNPGTYGVIQ